MLTPVDFVRQRAAMIDQWGREDRHVLGENIKFLADLTDLEQSALASDGRALCEEQRNMLIGSDMYLFTPELIECARQALNQLDPGEYLDLDPLPVGGVFAFTDPVRIPGSPDKVTVSVLLPVPGLILANRSDPDQRIQTGLLGYMLRSGLLEYISEQIAVGNDPERHRRYYSDRLCCDLR